MDPSELRTRRKQLGLSQAEFADKIGLSRDFLGRMERGAAPINYRTEAAVRRLSAAPFREPETLDEKVLRKLSSDPMEYLIETALLEVGIVYEKEGQLKGKHQRLDFYLPNKDLYIEVKRFHSPRAAEQLAHADNVILAQGRPAVEFLADAIRGGHLS